MRRAVAAMIAALAFGAAQAAPPVAGPDGHYYRFVAGAYGWDEADTISSDAFWVDPETGDEFMGQFAAVTSAEENSFVAALAGGDSAWLGAGADGDGSWSWRSGPETGAALSYSNWAVALPPGSDPLSIPTRGLLINAAGFGLWSASPASGAGVPQFGFVIEYVPYSAPIPEPAGAALLLAGLAALGVRRRGGVRQAT